MTANREEGEDQPAAGSTSQSLLAEARRADPAAWQRLASLYAPLVAAWCRRWGVAGQDVADVLQDVFLAVARNLEGFRKDRPTDTFRGWLLTIARSKAADYFRRRGREPIATGGTDAAVRLHEILDPHSPDEATGELPRDEDEAIFTGILARALDSIRGDFHEQTWRAFWGVVVEGRRTADVAAELNMRPGTVRVAKSRVLLRLRLELGDLGASGCT
jgi:RNA polymerase sigma-70 factor (ECF subfamily)